MLTTKTTTLITPYGGNLIDLRVAPEALEERKAYAGTLPSIQISPRAMCDLELLAVGAFSPLDRFMGKEDYQRVLDEMRLTSGHLFSMPITLPIASDDAVKLDQEVALRDSYNRILAIMRVEEIYVWDRDELSQKVFGTLDTRHPTVAEMHGWGSLNISGRLEVLEMPVHYDFKRLRRTPSEVRDLLEGYGFENVVAFQTRNPLHRAHEELTKRAANAINGVLLLHPVVGMTKPGDVDHYTRVRAYKALVDNYYDQNRVLLSLLPLAMRMGGPREALWHALIRRNYGANHFIVGRDHAGPGKDTNGKPFYGPYDAQQLVARHQEELGVKMMPFSEMMYLVDEDRYEEVDKIPEGATTASISGTQVREDYLGKGRQLPEWFTRPAVAKVLADSFPPMHRQGVCLWFTGLSGAGKSTISEILTVKLLEHGRKITTLDGDVVRTHLSKGLGFSQEDRDTNIRRIAFVASEISKQGGLVICAAISPYRSTRNDARNMVGEGFIEIYIATPLEECERRDTKGLYAAARRGEIKGFTGIDDPYEVPENPEITINTVNKTAEESAQLILDYLIERNYVQPIRI
jgi:sulfate adenylyltransferase